jgi:hypothetical protein
MCGGKAAQVNVSSLTFSIYQAEKFALGLHQCAPQANGIAFL